MKSKGQHASKGIKKRSKGKKVEDKGAHTGNRANQGCGGYREMRSHELELKSNQRERRATREKNDKVEPKWKDAYGE